MIKLQWFKTDASEKNNSQNSHSNESIKIEYKFLITPDI